MPFKCNLQRYNTATAFVSRKSSLHSQHSLLPDDDTNDDEDAADDGAGDDASADAVGLCTLNQVDPYPITYSLSNP